VSILVNLTILYHLRVRYKNALRITLSKMIPGRTLRDLYVLWLGSPFFALDFCENLRYSAYVSICTLNSRSGMKEVMPMGSSKHTGVTAGEAR
jgi:hypothetical protein